MNKKVSPKGGKRGCLCKNGKYSKKCCDGELKSQGIGNITGTGLETVTQTEVNGTRSRTRVSGQNLQQNLINRFYKYEKRSNRSN